MATRAQVVAEARTWLGTRWHHQAAVKGVGCDCIGLVRGVAVNVGIFAPDWHMQPELLPFHGYSRAPHDQRLEAFCEVAFGKPIPWKLAAPGDVLLMQWAQAPNHLALRTDHGLIHAYIPMRKVVESRFDEMFQSHTICAYRLPGITS